MTGITFKKGKMKLLFRNAHEVGKTFLKVKKGSSPASPESSHLRVKGDDEEKGHEGWRGL